MRRRLQISVSALLAAIAAATADAQTIRYVSKSGSHTPPFDTWARAATNVAAAVGAAGPNNVILVSNGVYELTATISLGNNITLRSVNGPAATTLAGNDTFRLFNLTGGARLHGVTLRDGRAGGTGIAGYGGAAYVNNGVISNCVIQSCSAALRGGGVYFFTSAAGLITHSVLLDNESPYGGGVYCRNVGTVSNCVFIGNRAIGSAGTGGGGVFTFAGGIVTHSRFANNTAGNDGGGVLMDRGGQVLNSSFEGNIAGDWGGGVAVYFTGGIVRNCLIVSNRADEGGGVYFHLSGTLENSTVVANSSILDGSGVKFSGGGTSINSIVYFNVGDNVALHGSGQSFQNSCTTPAISGPADRGGNISDDPAFLYLPENVLHLRPGSPCIGAATNRPWMSGATDIHGSPRLIAGTADIGAYEFGPLVCHFVGDPRNGAPPLSVAFESHVTGSNLTGLVYRWDAQNDGTFEASSPLASAFQHTYETAGFFSVRLAVTNAAAEVATLTRTNYILANAPHYVATNGGHVSPFLTWATAATNLQAAVDVATAGGTIYVSNGSYSVTSEIVVTQPVFIASMNGPSVTTIRAAGGTRVFRIAPGVVLAGFTIRDGVATGAAERAHGGGVFLDGGGVLTNCVLVANRASGFGGGAYLSFGGLIRDSIVWSNRAQWGGGVACWQGGMVYNTRLTTNIALDRGGGAFVVGNSIIRNCIVDRNAAVSNGGGVALISSGSTVQNCTIVSNTAARGGGILCEDGGNVQNTIAYFNSASVADPNWQTNTVTFNYGAFFSDTCLTPTTGLPNATACFTNEPQFEFALGSPYSLGGLSPCVNRGRYAPWMTGTHDILGTPRVVGGAPDIGALERLVLALAIASPQSGNRFPFGATFVQVSGTAQGLTGLLSYTSVSPAGVRSGTLAVSSNWSFSVHMPRHGPYTISVNATNAAGHVAVDELTILRNRNQVFVPARSP